jgi:hypothetical protein
MVTLPPIHPSKVMMMTKLLLFLCFFGTVWGSDSFQEQALPNPQPLVSFANWSKPLPFRALDVQDQSALIEVEIKPVSQNCEVLEDCLPAYRVEHWHIPDLTREGYTKAPIKLGELVAARLAGTETFFFYRDRLVITDSALNVLKRVSYPEILQERLDDIGSPVVGVANGGDFVFIETFLWDRQRRHWHSDQRWKLISPDIAMGDNRAMALGSYHSGEVWLIPYRAPKKSHRFKAREFQRIILSPDERRLLIEEKSGLHRLIDVENRDEVQHWKQRIHYQQISWRNNRTLTIERNGRWTLHQIEPHQIIARGSQSEDSFAIVSEQLPIGIFLNSGQNTAKLIHLDDGRQLGQQKLPELGKSWAWLGQNLPLAYSRKPLTLMLGGGLTKLGVQQFRPYRLEMRKNEDAQTDNP